MDNLAIARVLTEIGDLLEIVQAVGPKTVARLYGDLAMEINAQIDRLDLDDAQARRAWLTPADVLTTCSVEELRGSLRRRA